MRTTGQETKANETAVWSEYRFSKWARFSWGKLFEDRRTTQVAATPAALFAAVCRIGGGHGWYAADLLWRLRGALDRLAGGPGLRRGRRDPDHVVYGDALDFWRVTGVEPDRSLSLRAEMKLPGEALLRFEITPDAGDPTRSLLTQIARFQPRGLAGLAYWYAVAPFHGLVFRGMLEGIRREATRTGPQGSGPSQRCRPPLS